MNGKEAPVSVHTQHQYIYIEKTIHQALKTRKVQIYFVAVSLITK